VRIGALIGCARVSTSGQLFDRQQRTLAEAGCTRVFADKFSGMISQMGQRGGANGSRRRVPARSQ
jgi:DNA invertase Pin-like site-specific DNA recombinase